MLSVTEVGLKLYGDLSVEEFLTLLASCAADSDNASLQPAEEYKDESCFMPLIARIFPHLICHSDIT